VIAKEVILPRSYKVMEAVLQHGDAGEPARLLSCSFQLIRSWCSTPETEDQFSTGKFGQLDWARTAIAMVYEDDGLPERAYHIGRYIAGRLSEILAQRPICL